MSDIELVAILRIGIYALTGMLVYAYVLFPLCMAVIGRNYPHPIPRSTDLPLVSLIIPAHNEADVIEHKLANSQSLDYPNLEIIVASDGSSDQTVDIARSAPDVTVLDFAKRRGKTAIVADAVDQSNGEILCLCDANVMFESDAIWKLVSRLIVEQAGGVTGDVRLQSSDSSFGFAEALYYKLERSIHRGESRLGAVTGVDGGMYVIRRELFCRLPADTVLDDFSLSMNVLRAGRKLLYEPEAIANENATVLAMDEFRRRVRIGKGAMQVIIRGFIPRWSQPERMLLFVSHKLLRWVSPFLLLTLLLLATVLSLYDKTAFLVLAPGLALVLLAGVGALVPSLRQLGLVSVPFYFCLSQIGFAWGMITGLLFGTTGTWSRTTRHPINDTNRQGKY